LYAAFLGFVAHPIPLGAFILVAFLKAREGNVLAEMLFFMDGVRNQNFILLLF
jgi:hypothetical protein